MNALLYEETFFILATNEGAQVTKRSWLRVTGRFVFVCHDIKHAFSYEKSTDLARELSCRKLNEGLP